MGSGGDEVGGLDDTLDFERGGADHGMCLVGLTVGELSNGHGESGFPAKPAGKDWNGIYPVPLSRTSITRCPARKPAIGT